MATEGVAQIANDAAGFAQVLQWNLLVARSGQATAAERVDAMERAFAAWPALCRRMSALETLVPRSSQAGYAVAERLREIAEAARERDHDAAAGAAGGHSEAFVNNSSRGVA